MAISFRNSRGHFTSVTPREETIYKWENGTRTELSMREKFEIYATRKNIDRSIEFEIIGRDEDWVPKWKTYTDKSRPKITVYTDENGNIIDRPFEFSYKLYKDKGYNEEKQREIYELFREANKEVKKLQELTDAMVGQSFSLNLDVPSERLERRIASAEEVLSGNYLNNISIEYKEKFTDEITTHLDSETSRRFKEALDSITPLQFLQLIKNTNFDFLAFALESEIETYGYEMVLNQINYLIDSIEDGEGEFYY